MNSTENKLIYEPVIKWSGSKRNLASKLLIHLPKKFNQYFEPFLGGGAIFYLIDQKHKKIGSDINKPLIELWNLIKENPQKVINAYRKNWKKLNDPQNSESYKVFYQIRDSFNKNQKPEDLLFLSRTCVNGLIRFNKKGEFNNSLHYTRKGINPIRFEKILFDWSSKIQSSAFYYNDYTWILNKVKKNDLVYLDPPYFNTKGRYYGRIDLERFLNFIEKLNSIGSKYILSLDGKTEKDDYDNRFTFPKELFKYHFYIENGNSTFRKVIDKNNIKVTESVYINFLNNS